MSNIKLGIDKEQFRNGNQEYKQQTNSDMLKLRLIESMTRT